MRCALDNGLRSWEYENVYEASNSHLIDDFYVPSLRRATRYDRAAGYFRSSVFHLVSVALSDFVLREGRMRLVCSPSLDDADEATIRRLGVTSEAVEKSLTRDIELSLENPDSLPVVEFLATLISVGALDIRIAYKADERGIFHPKVGVFHDGVDAVSFEGSANETYMAWEHNEERFKAFCTWRGQGELVAADQRYFDDLWDGERASLVVKPLPSIPLRLLQQHALPDPEAAIERVRVARRRRARPSGPIRRLQDHQLAVKHNWWPHQRGIVNHVTGGGKTLTALAIVREWFERKPYGSAVIVVPSDLLSKQWTRELEAELGDLNLRFLHVGGELSSSDWREYVPDFTREAPVRGRRVIVATMDSAANTSFLERASFGAQTLLVVDEVHKVGSPRRSSLLSLEAGGRLGLSATPERFEDPDGTARIFDYFGPTLPPPFTIRQAQQSIPPRLVQYVYRPAIVYLNAIELERHSALTKQIATLSARLRAGDASASADRLRQVLLDRARVLKSAGSKPAHGAAVIADEYQSGERWLVYCDDNAQLAALRSLLRDRGIEPMIYTSDMIFSKPDTLVRFERVGGILLSIRCLDEGIDIPLVSHALILASSINPREHLQRRGRVLRCATGKTRATIHDVLVGPTEDEPERVFVQDLNRARSFADDAQNRRQASWRLDSLQPYPGPSSAEAWGDVEDDE